MAWLWHGGRLVGRTTMLGDLWASLSARGWLTLLRVQDGVCHYDVSAPPSTWTGAERPKLGGEP